MNDRRNFKSLVLVQVSVHAAPRRTAKFIRLLPALLALVRVAMARWGHHLN